MRSAKLATGTPAVETEIVQVVVADSESHSVSALDPGLEKPAGLSGFRCRFGDVCSPRLHAIESGRRGLGCGNHLPDLSLLRWLRVSYPNIAPVLLAENDDRELVVNALRAGAKGIFLFTQTPFPMLCKCIHCVSQGQVWLNSQQMNYVLDALSEVPTLRVVNSTGRSLLTPREEQVVALVADGLTNRGVASELGLSEHTIKKYLLRIFDKVGISSRVELVLYAMSHGENRAAEWMPSSA